MLSAQAICNIESRSHISVRRAGGDRNIVVKLGSVEVVADVSC